MMKILQIAAVTAMGYSAQDTDAWYEQYQRHLATARARGLDSQLSFDQYMIKAAEANLLCVDQIGRASHQFQLGRVGDVGNYHDGNCRFITARQNHQESYQNGRSIESDKARSATMTGQTKETSDRVRKMAQTKTGRTKETNEGLAITSAKLAKSFILTSPDGLEVRGKNLSEFCDQNNLSKFAMYDVLAGRRPHHKGWRGNYE